MDFSMDFFMEFSMELYIGCCGVARPNSGGSSTISPLANLVELFGSLLCCEDQTSEKYSVRASVRLGNLPPIPMLYHDFDIPCKSKQLPGARGPLMKTIVFLL